MKIYKYNEPKKEICYFDTNLAVEIPDVYEEKPFRALWVSNVLNIDLPTTKDIDVYQRAVLKMLDTCVDYRLTAIFFQCRTSNDAFYRSQLNPYSRYLTGQEGEAPPFDVFKWIIEETHKRGLEFHAWMNPYRVSTKETKTKDEWFETCDDLNIAKKHPEWTVTDKLGKIVLNPARKEVKQFIVDTILELISNYDVDGIHFDDYFYPYGGLSVKDDDHIEFENRLELDLDLDGFRRNEVTKAIRMINSAIKSVNPKIRFGISPFGIWRKKTATFLEGANVHKGCSESYTNEYGDSYRWVQEELVDYICPQIYFNFEHRLAPFADLVDWWVNALKHKKADLYIGFGPYRLGREGGYESPYEISNQLHYANQYKEVKGNIFFTYHTFIDEGPTKEGMGIVKKLFNRKEDIK